MTLQTILFDLDGTLLDSAPGLMTSTNTALARCGCPPRSLAQITAAMGNGMADLSPARCPAGRRTPALPPASTPFRKRIGATCSPARRPIPAFWICWTHCAAGAAAWPWYPTSATVR